MATADEMTIALSPELAEFVRDSVRSGRYGSAGEAIDEAVREWKERRENYGYTIAELRALIQEGIDSGPTEPFDVEGIKAEARRRLASVRG